MGHFWCGRLEEETQTGCPMMLLHSTLPMPGFSVAPTIATDLGEKSARMFSIAVLDSPRKKQSITQICQMEKGKREIEDGKKHRLEIVEGKKVHWRYTGSERRAWSTRASSGVYWGSVGEWVCSIPLRQCSSTVRGSIWRAASSTNTRRRRSSLEAQMCVMTSAAVCTAPSPPSICWARRCAGSVSGTRSNCVCAASYCFAKRLKRSTTRTTFSLSFSSNLPSSRSRCSPASKLMNSDAMHDNVFSVIHCPFVSVCCWCHAKVPATNHKSHGGRSCF